MSTWLVGYDNSSAPGLDGMIERGEFWMVCRSRKKADEAAECLEVAGYKVIGIAFASGVIELVRTEDRP